MIRITRVLVLIVGLLAASGCLTGSDDPDPTPPPAEPPTATSIAELMRFIKTAYNEMNAGLYESQLHPGFQFVLKDQTGTLDRDLEAAIARSIFNGEIGENGIAFEDVAVISMVALEAWAEVTDEDEVFGDFSPDAWFCPYDLSIDYSVRGQYLTYQVRGVVVVYAIEVDNGLQLLGLEDRTNGDKATEAHSWSSIRRLYY